VVRKSSKNQVLCKPIPEAKPEYKKFKHRPSLGAISTVFYGILRILFFTTFSSVNNLLK